MNHFRRILNDEQATTSVEYAVMLAMILLVMIVGVAAFGNAQDGAWAKIDTELTTHGF